MNRFVLDASVALGWLVDVSTAPYAVHVRQLLDHGDQAVVPAVWESEIANGFVVAERRGVLTASDTTQVLSTFDAILVQSIIVRREPRSIRRIIMTARESGLTAYDAEYLYLAKEEHLPLATLDRALAQAARKIGVALLS